MSSLEAESCVVSRDRISALPDDLLIQILLLVKTKDAVATMFLSKRLRFIWTMVPKLEYIDTGDECESLCGFINKSMEVHKAPVLETLRIRLGEKCPITVDVGKWVSKAVDRFVRELEVELLWTAESISLPKSIYTCKSLVVLTLSGKILVDVPSSVCLPSLKILRLVYVVYKTVDCLVRLLSSCSFLYRVLVNISDCGEDVLLKRNLTHFSRPHIFVLCNADDKFMSSMPLVRSLSLRLKDPMAVNFSGITFSRLIQIILDPRYHLWIDLLQIILNDSPNLGMLHIHPEKGFLPGYIPLSWHQSSYVPRCLSFHLAIFEWIEYGGSKDEEELVRYILANSKCLIKAKITLRSEFNHEEKEKIVKELKSMFRVSTKSKLLFE
ncbi:putative F-box/FBD/LRR-repeat protein At5g52460 [Arabidopsis lyrata subsp. lyrata]|uniref:putative F-box/FBD/LRR-repeat protein At5g52460 n=1 Tax=Arabidopsis lyrata subsp. lyrata TaxID=81972 RepID=UPI000A29A538|nr:putative F-box/FBD/LRR-repeat protein At5g52460 [Arabidopsis lyrata subsp. lyrata]|eukprot:XP_020881621.1 putative F-box/FBD/LRR-repeat protein At5g52460 [Arabidopsis lyrata subsp. lyrata]